MQGGLQTVGKEHCELVTMSSMTPKREERDDSWQANGIKRRERRMSRQRREILKVASYLFAKEGYEGTTLEMIADELGLSKPGLYYYIHSKADVLMQIHEDLVQGIIDRVHASITPEMPPDERLWRLIVAHTIAQCSHPAMRGIILSRAHLLNERARDVVALRDRYQKAVEAIIVEGIEQGVFHVSDAKLATFTILGALNWMPSWYSPDGPVSLEAISENFATTLVGGLVTPLNTSFTQPNRPRPKKPGTADDNSYLPTTP